VQLVVSYTKTADKDTFNGLNLANLHLVYSPNDPLGNKWQAAVNAAKTLSPDCVVILGSDDEINDDYIKNAYKLLAAGYDFIGLRRYNVIYKRRKYILDYKPVMPLGGGRVYSRKMLDTINWQLFQPLNRKLDDYGWQRVIKSGLRAISISETSRYGMEITAIKGDWAMLNPFNPNHPNLKIIKVTNVRD
jgi:hypothetical protein